MSKTLGVAPLAVEDHQNLEFVERKVEPSPGLIMRIEGGNVTLNEALVKNAFGTADNGFILGAMQQVTRLAVRDNEIDRQQLDFIAGALVGINPANTVEAMLAAQMVSTHLLTMKLAEQTLRAKSTEEREALERMFTKLSRTFPAQIEALHKFRHGGQQKVTVEHVNVADGGQAIIGNVSGGGRG